MDCRLLHGDVIQATNARPEKEMLASSRCGGWPLHSNLFETRVMPAFMIRNENLKK
jgi:hypothetical protein